MKKSIVLLLVGISIVVSSCNRYVFEGGNCNNGSGGCGVWYPKKFKV